MLNCIQRCEYLTVLKSSKQSLQLYWSYKQQCL